MKKTTTILGCAALLACGGAVAQTTAPTGIDNKVEWRALADWKIDGKPLDLVHSLDGNLVYVLNDKQRVLVYDSNGTLLGRVPVAKGVTAIDIAPQGEELYLLDQDRKTFSRISVSFIAEVDVTGSPFKGKADAPVTIAVFTDFE